MSRSILEAVEITLQVIIFCLRHVIVYAIALLIFIWAGLFAIRVLDS